MMVDKVSLSFDVVECSSEEDGFECTALQIFREDGDGWLSERNCTYPQVLILKIHHQDDAGVIDRLDILCHEFCITQTIEISIGYGSIDGEPPSALEECESIHKLGYVTMHSNVESDYQDRELKSVPIGKPADFIKLVLHQNYENKYNEWSQIGVIGLRVFAATGIEEDVSMPAKIAAAIEDKRSQRPSFNISLPSPLPNALPPKVKQDLEPKIQQSVDRLEKLKKERAALEDFETAATIKEAMGKVYALLMCFKDNESKMRKAAVDEDYTEAARMKLERDTVKEAALEALLEVEQKFIGHIEDIQQDLSLSTIKDESFMSHRSNQSAQPFAFEGDQSHLASPSRSHSKRNESSIHDQSIEDQFEDEEDVDDDSNVPRAHQLAGVDHAEELPTPEAISKEVSSDLIQKVNDMFGDYRTQCFFSKNWQLREAVIAKMGLLIRELFDGASLDACAEMASTLTLIISRSIDDKNVQVFQSALILLDETLLVCEQKELPQAKVTLLMSKVISDVLSKLADSKPKVVDSAELSLLALAHSSCIDFASICNAATKKIKTADSKGGRTLKARLQFIDNLISEFDEDVPWKRVIDFAKASKAFDHKDASVREAAKSVVLTLMVVHGEDTVMQSLEDSDQVSDRQLNEYRAKYAAIVEE